MRWIALGSLMVFALLAASLNGSAARVQAQESCHTSYQGACLDANATDYDCLGGEEDGPLYTGQVTVVGPDPFGLDNDGDGLGCETSPASGTSTTGAAQSEVAGAAQAPTAGFGPGKLRGNDALTWVVAALIGAGVAWLTAGTAIVAIANSRRAPPSTEFSGFVPSLRPRQR